MLTLAKIFVDSIAGVQFKVLLGVHLLDCVKQNVEILNAFEIVGE